MQIFLYDLLVKSATYALRMQEIDGSMPAGHNGSYYDPETPVRNTSHWLITFCKAYEISGDEKFKHAAMKSIDYLTSDDARPMEKTFWHRKNPKKDFSNGLVGQAWTIEALLEGYKCFGDDSLLKLASDVFDLHPYDDTVDGWMIVNVDGSNYRLDGTYNHQLWFAAVGALLSKYQPERKKGSLDKFLKRLEEHTSIYNDGCVRHMSIDFLSGTIEKKMVKFYKQKIKGASKSYIRMKSVGYHGFNLYAYALIYNVFPELSFWKTPKFQSIKSVVATNNFKKEIINSKYGYPYNPPGLEIPFFLQSFNLEKDIKYWLKQQFDLTFNKEKGLMELGETKDPNTAAARIYEACRLNNYEFEF